MKRLSLSLFILARISNAVDSTDSIIIGDEWKDINDDASLCRFNRKKLVKQTNKGPKQKDGAYGNVEIYLYDDKELLAIKTIFSSKVAREYENYRNVAQHYKGRPDDIMKVPQIYCVLNTHQNDGKILMQGIDAKNIGDYLNSLDIWDIQNIHTLVDIYGGILRGIKQIREQKFWYLDPNPGNILIDKNRQLWFVDLGNWMYEETLEPCPNTQFYSNKALVQIVLQDKPFNAWFCGYLNDYSTSVVSLKDKIGRKNVPKFCELLNSIPEDDGAVGGLNESRSSMIANVQIHILSFLLAFLYIFVMYYV